MLNIKNALAGLISGLLVTAAATFTPGSAQADILSVSNQITVISPPPSVITGAYSNNLIYLFPERTSFTLTNNVRVNITKPGTYTSSIQVVAGSTNIATSTLVESYYLHHAGPTSNNVATASITFDTNVLGIICIASDLVASHTQLGALPTVYQTTAGSQGYELGTSIINDKVTLSADGRTVTVTTSASPGAQDDLRIILAGKPAFQSPVANAGTNQTVNALDTVILDGSGSSDPNSPPLPLTYSWSQASGIPVTLTGANTVSAMFTAPNVPASGAVLVFQLVVSNGASQPATNLVSVTVAGVNTPPIANAGPNQSVGEATLVTLDGSGSSDANNDVLTLQWSQVSGPAVTLSGANTVNPTFTAPNVTHALGSVALQFQLVVNDGQVSSAGDTVSITVTNVNDAPVANAGNNQTVNELQAVTLNGTASSDPDGNTLTYTWTQILGSPTVTLSGANTATPSFTAPQLNIGGTNGSITLTFKLTVSDGIAQSTGTVNVQVNNVDHAPIADAGPDQTVPAGTTVTLSGTNSSDIDGDPLTFIWTQVNGPSVTLDGANTDTATFIAPTVGPSGATLFFQLKVSDGFPRGTISNTVAVHVTYVDHPPTVSAGSAQTVNEGDTVTLAGTASDPDGDALTFSWAQISGPAVTLANDTTLTPSFTAPAVTRDETNVVLQLTADDGFGGITSDEVSIHIANINHAPVAQAPANFTVPEGTAVNLIGQGTDPDTEEQSQLAFAWAQTAGPTVALSGAGPNASFTAPLVTDGGDPDAKVTLTFALTVTDPNGAASTNSVDVVVANVDHTPTAVAGNNLMVNEGSPVTLNGSASSDPDLDTLTYAWAQVAGPAVTLSGANTAFPSFTAPLVNAAGATLQFQLTVDDGFGGTNSATTTVTVNNINDPPVSSNAVPSIATLWPPNHGMVKVAINGVTDPNNNATITITGVTQDEPTSGGGDGDTAVDAVINGDGTVLLRAERAASGDGRVYHVHFTATDFEGSSPGVVTVSVPKNKKSDGAVDGGELYDSTQ